MVRVFCQGVSVPLAALQPGAAGLSVNHGCGTEDLEQVTWLGIEAVGASAEGWATWS